MQLHRPERVAKNESQAFRHISAAGVRSERVEAEVRAAEGPVKDLACVDRRRRSRRPRAGTRGTLRDPPSASGQGSRGTPPATPARTPTLRGASCSRVRGMRNRRSSRAVGARRYVRAPDARRRVDRPIYRSSRRLMRSSSDGCESKRLSSQPLSPSPPLRGDAIHIPAVPRERRRSAVPPSASFWSAARSPIG